MPQVPEPKQKTVDFDGNVDSAIEQLWSRVIDNTLSREEVKGVTLLMSSAGSIPDHVSNKLVLDAKDRIGKREADLQPTEGDRNVLVRSRTTVPLTNKEEGPTKTVPHEHFDKIGRLTQRVELISKKSHRTWNSV